MKFMSQTEIVSTFSKLQKLNGQLIAMRRDGILENIPFHKRTSLFKRYKRYLKRLFSVEHPLSKAVSLVALALLLSTEGPAQCTRFVSADVSNPLKPETQPFNLIRPVLVDIDGDGDLDCYADHPAEQYFLSQFAFLRNTGSNTSPEFQLDGTGGLPGTTDFYAGEVDGPTFCDLDGDGDFDCFVGDYRHLEYFENTGDKFNPEFVQRPFSENPLNFIFGYYGLYFNLVDFDHDGDFDMFTNNLYFTGVYENIGTATNPDFVLYRGEDYGLFHVNPYYGHFIFTDWNKDALTDAINVDGTSHVYYRNDGNAAKPHFVRDNRGDPEFPPGFSAYTMVDLNNDGFPEVFSSDLKYAINPPVPSIVATSHDSFTRLDAQPKGPFTYRWRKDGTIILNETGDFIRVNEPGSYAVEVTGNCGANLSLPYILGNQIAGIPSSLNLSATGSKNIHLQLYPNPFTGECILKFEKAVTVKTIVQVMDAQGKLVTSVNAVNNIVRFGKELKPGIYFVQVIQNNAVIYRQKIIKQ
jgi:hypothetical protein